MPISPLDLLNHILDEVTFLCKEQDKLTEDEFIVDEKTKRAFVRSLEIIGEASKGIPDEFRQKYDHIEWKEMARMRDRLIHHYFGVDYYIVWSTVQENIPTLKDQIMDILSKEQGMENRNQPDN